MIAREYITLLKPLQTSLLIFTSLSAYLAAPYEKYTVTALLLVASMSLAVAGSTAVTMYLDKDIDSAMTRTKTRPVPRGKIRPKDAMVFGAVLYIVGQALSFKISMLVATAVFLGFFFDVVVYTFLKRRTTTNILFGGIAGMMPALGGWLANSNAFSPSAMLLPLLVFLWVPIHIWYISFYYKKDYERAKIAMLPTRASTKTVALATGISGLLMELDIIIMYAVGIAKPAALVLSTSMVALLLFLIAEFAKEPTKERARMIFKLAGISLLVIFVALALGK